MLSEIKNVRIEAISACLPDKILSLTEYAPNLITEKEVKRFVKNTGFSTLAIADDNVTASDLCQKAAENIFSTANINKSEIDALIFVSQTPDWYLPATSHYLQYKLGLSEDVLCFDINEGCSGYVQGLYLASALIQSKQCKKVLLLAGDTISKITNPDDRATRLIFGDAGTASIMSYSKDKNMYFNINTYGGRYQAIITANSRHRTTPLNTGDRHLSLDGMAIMDFTLNDVPLNMQKLMQFADGADKEIDYYICHQANKLILNALADKIDIAHDKIPFAAGKTGNTSSASIPLLLCQNQYENLQKVMLCGFGVGLACASCIADLSDTKILDVINYGSSNI